MYKESILADKASTGQDDYDRNCKSCCRHYDFFMKPDFISFVEHTFFE